jgi:hypothetical protein
VLVQVTLPGWQNRRSLDESPGHAGTRASGTTYKPKTSAAEGSASGIHDL